MIDSRLYIKSLNATEAGESNTNDSYILIPKMFDATSFFGLTGSNKMFFDVIDTDDNSKYGLRFEVTSSTKEQRIYMLGAFCRKKNLHAGDKICIENLKVDGNSTFFIRYLKRTNIVLLQKLKGDYLIERNDKGSAIFQGPMQLDYNGQKVDLTLSFKYHGKKRNDSPDEFDFYEAYTDTGYKFSDLNKDQYVIIDFNEMAIIPFEKTTEYRISQN